ncbi:hypothetical protein ACFV6F_39545 [Kitasatospora phosalacinea]|uniref:hypothetical protein n=1 Tax=Kitasatospora phosalacinea TaxID=2065 RepID=UPI003646D670
MGAEAAAALMNRLSADYNATVPSSTPHFYSWDTLGPSPITPKTGAFSIGRPSGGGPALLTLNSYSRTTVDFAASTQAPPYMDPPTFKTVVLGKDAVTWSAKAGGHAPANLTTQDLYDIYSCALGKTNWAAFGGGAGTIKPYLPQAGSDTRAFFLNAIGNPTLGACVVTGPQENQGTDPLLNDVDVIFPYSAGHWVGQANGHTTATDDKGTLTLRGINGIAPLTATGTLNPVFAGSTYGRVLYNVFRYSEWNAFPATPQSTALRAIFGSTGYLCSAAGRATVAGYGFLAVPAATCGT